MASAANECLELIERLDRYLRRGVPRRKERDAAKAIRFNGDLSSYFDRRTFDEVLLARRYFLHTPPSNGSESLVFSCLLHILHGNRPYALSRRSHPLTPFAPSGPVEYRPLIPRLRAKVERSVGSQLPESFVPGRTVNQDATAWWPSDMGDLECRHNVSTILQQYTIPLGQLDAPLVFRLGNQGLSRETSGVCRREAEAEL